MNKLGSKTVLAVLSVNLIGFGQASNADVVLLNEFRSVSASASVTTPIGSESVSSSRNSLGDFADFDKLVEADVALDAGSANGTAQQTSQMSTASISASGHATANAEITAFDPMFFTSADGNANTSLSVTFELPTSQLFDLSGTVSSLNSSGFPFGQAEVSLSSQDGSVNLTFRTPFFDGGTTPFDLSGTLFPNIYTLNANASIGANAFGVEMVAGTADFAFDLQFRPVPIPAAAWLFGSGLLGMIGISRRKKAA
jgi:hypothetical protein